MVDKEALTSLFAEAAIGGWTLHSDIKLQEWLGSFSERLKKKSDAVTDELQKLLDFTDTVEQELFNTFNKFRGLSSTQFIENRVREDDESISTCQRASLQEQDVPSQSFENDIVPRYKEALSGAWTSYQELMTRPCRKSLIVDQFNSRMMRERCQKQLPHIIGTDEFMRDSSCGVEEGWLSGFEAFAYDTETERDGATMAAEIAGSCFLPGQWSESESDISHDLVGGFEPAVSAALDFKAMLEAALRNPYMPCENLKEISISSNTTTISNTLHRNMSEEEVGIKEEDFHLASSGTGTLMDQQVEDLVKIERAPPAGPSNIEILDSISKQRNAGKVSILDEMTNPAKPLAEHVEEHVQQHCFFDLFPSPVVSSGLSGDVDENEFNPRRIVTGKSSAPSVPAQTLNRLHMHEREHIVKPSSNLVQPDLAKQRSSATTQQASEGNGVPPDKTAEGAFSEKKETTRSLKLFPSNRSANSHLSKEFSFLGKGLFEDDSDENDEDDLFGSTRITEKLQDHGNKAELRLSGSIDIVKNIPSQEESNIQHVEPGKSLEKSETFWDLAPESFYLGKDQVKNTNDKESPGRTVYGKTEEQLPEDHGLRIGSVKNQLATTHLLSLNAVASKSLLDSQEDSSSWSSSSSLDHLSQDVLKQAADRGNELHPHGGDQIVSIDSEISPTKRNRKHEQKQFSGNKFPERHSHVSANQNSHASGSILSALEGSISGKESMQGARTSLDMLPDTEDSCVGTGVFPSISSSSTRKDRMENTSPKQDIMRSVASGLDVRKQDTVEEVGDDIHLSHPVLFRPIGSSKRRAPTLVKRISSVRIPVLPSSGLNQHLTENSKPKVSEILSGLGEKSSQSSFEKEDGKSLKYPAYIHTRPVIYESSNPLNVYNERAPYENAQKILPTVLITSLSNPDGSVTQLSAYQDKSFHPDPKSPDTEFKNLPFPDGSVTELPPYQDKKIHPDPKSSDIESKALSFSSLVLADEEDDKSFGPFQANSVFGAAVMKQKDVLMLQNDDGSLSPAHSITTLRCGNEPAPTLLDKGTGSDSVGPSRKSFYSLLFSDDNDDNDENDK